VIPEAQRLALLESSKLKLAGTARLAEGGKDAGYEAAVLFHAAARAERRTLLATPDPSPEARLRGAIEICGCFIDGRDPIAVLETAWGELLDASERVPASTAQALRARVDGDVAAFVAEHRHALAKAPALKAWMDAGAQPEKARPLGKELDRLLAAFPGDARLWGVRSQVYLRDKGDVARAWEANRRALSLAPDDPIHRQQELFLIPRHLAPADAERRLDAAYAELVRGETNTDVCFGFIAAAMALARRRRDRKRLLQMALDAASIGFGLPPLSPLDRAMFRAMQLIARALLAGHTPGVDILYRAGLGLWAAGMSAGADPLEVLTDHWSPLRYARAA
jgi:hypothetical protein